MLVPSTPVYVATNEAAAYCRLSKPYLEKLRSNGGGPAFRKVGRRILYRLSDIEAWIDKHVQASTTSDTM